MRSHREIIQAHGAAALVRDLARIGIEVHQTTPQRWADRNSVPGEYWGALVDLGLGTLEELAEAAEARKFPEVAQQRDAAA